jgi:hypothetical protein
VRLRDDASHFSCATFVSGRPRRRMSATLPGTTAGVDALLGRLVTDWRPTIVGLRTAKRGLGAYQGGECRTPQSGEWWRGACTPYALVFGRPGQGHCPPAVLGESGAAAPRSPAGRNLRGDRGRLRRSPASWRQWIGGVSLAHAGRSSKDRTMQLTANQTGSVFVNISHTSAGRQVTNHSPTSR